VTHDELKAKVDRLHLLMFAPSEGSITYQVAVGNLVQDLCDAWGRTDPAKVARAALEAAAKIGQRHDCESPICDWIRAIIDSPEAIAAIIEAARKAP